LFTEQAFTILVSDVRINGFATATPARYTENAAPLLIGNVGTVSDVQLSNFDGGTLTAWLSGNGTMDDRLSLKSSAPAHGAVSVNFQTGVVSYTTTTLGTYPIGMLSGGTGLAPLVITFHTNAKRGEVQTVLRAVNFANVSDNPSAAQRLVSFAITDGDGGISNTATRAVDVIPSNDKPVVTASGNTVTYIENDPGILIDATMQVVDPDSANLAGGKMIVTATGAQTTDRIEIQPGGSISINTGSLEVSYDGLVIGTYSGTSSLTVNLNANATVAKVQELARRISFRSISDAPTPTRSFSFVLSDGDGGTSSPALGDTINIAPTNDAPVLTLSDAVAAKYIENAAPLLIANAATVVDVDLLNFNRGVLTAEFTNNGDPEDTLAIKHIGTGANQVSVSGNTISYTNASLTTYSVATFTVGNGTTPLAITFNSNALKTEVQAVMRAIVYSNTSENPSTVPRTVSFTLTDGGSGTSNIVNRTINVVAVNDKTVVTDFGSDINYTIGDAPPLIAAAAVVTDADSADFNAGRIVVSLADANAADRLEISTGVGVTINGNKVYFNGDVIGTYWGTTSLTVLFNTAFATPSAAQAVLRRITFRTTAIGVSPTRTLTTVILDGDNATRVQVAKTINVHN
jgi:hypothetical protein